jgi:hypothetical protein
MTLPASGQISMSTFNTEMGQASTYSSSLNWIYTNTKTAQRPATYNMGGFYSKAWYRRNNDGNCANGNCTSNCNCGNIQCTNCVITGQVNCTNCDPTNYLQNNCNCACTYNCTFGNTTYNCDCNCACGNG